MTGEIEVVPTPLHVVRAIPRAGVVDLPPVDIYAARRWRLLRAKPVNPGQHLDTDSGEYCRLAQPLHWMGLLHSLLPHRWLRNRQALITVAVVVVLALLGVWPAQLLLEIALGVHGVLMVWNGLQWRASALIVTDRRLICPSGVLGRAVASTPLNRITDHTYYQSLLGRWLGYGTLRVETGGRHDDGADRELIRWMRDVDVVDRMLGPSRSRW